MFLLHDPKMQAAGCSSPGGKKLAQKTGDPYSISLVALNHLEILFFHIFTHF